MKRLSLLLITSLLITSLQAQLQKSSKSELLKMGRSMYPGAMSADLNAAAAGTVCLKDSTYTRNWFQSSNQWGNPNKTVFHYDWKGKPFIDVNSTLLNDQWNITGRKVRGYDQASNLLIEQNETWASTQHSWQPTSHLLCTYNSANKLLTWLTENWDYQMNGWRGVFRNTNIYDSNNNLSSSHDEMLTGPATSTWQPISQSTYTFNNNNLLTQEIYQQYNYSLTVFENHSKTLFNYDVFGNMITGTLQTWGGSWQNAERFTGTYNGNKMTNYTIEIYDNQANNWLKSEKGTSTYDANGNLLVDLYQSWDDQSNSWMNETRYTNTYDSKNNQLSALNEEWSNNAWRGIGRFSANYDANNNQIHTLTESWIPSESKWINVGQSDSWYNCTTVGITGVSTHKDPLFFYPNPAQEKLYINYTNEVGRVYIHDVSGKVVYASSASAELDIRGLEKGIYFVLLFSNKDVVIGSGKVIKE